MTQCNSRSELGILQNREIIANFDGGLIGSDGGLMLLQKIDQQLGLTKKLAGAVAGRHDPENRIKELKCDLRIDRTSCHRFLANQFRLFLHAAAFVLFNGLGKLLSGTQWAKAQVATLQRDLIKLGVRVKQTARKVWLPFGKLTALSTPKGTSPRPVLWPICGR